MKRSCLGSFSYENEYHQIMTQGTQQDEYMEYLVFTPVVGDPEFNGIDYSANGIQNTSQQ